jgi:hypothetical protein
MFMIILCILQVRLTKYYAYVIQDIKTIIITVLEECTCTTNRLPTTSEIRLVGCWAV